MGRKRRDVPWLEQRENGVYYAHWYDDEARQTRRQSMDTRDNIEARNAFADFLKNGPKSAKHVGDAGVTVGQILTWYDTGVPDLFAGHIAANVVDKTRQRIAVATLRAHFDRTPVRDVDISAADEYAERRRAGLVASRRSGAGSVASDSTIRRELGVLEAAAAWCVKRKLLPVTDVPQIEKPKEPHNKAPWLTKRSVQTIFEKAEGRFRAFCRLTYYWGARRRSVESLWVSQVDLKHGRVDLHKPGSKRTKKRRPIVPIYPEIRRDIETLLLETDNEYLFGSPRGFYRDFVALCAEHNIPVVDAEGETPWPHLLRHSRATHMLMDGEDPYKVAKLLGDTLATVERVYGHHTPEYLQTKSNAEIGTNP